MQETQEMEAQSLGWEGLLEEGMATHSSILAWEIPWTEEPGGLQSMGFRRVGHDRVTEHKHAHTHTHVWMFVQVVSPDSGGAEVSKPMSVPWMQSFLYLGSARETSGEKGGKTILDLSVSYNGRWTNNYFKMKSFKNEYIHGTEEMLRQSQNCRHKLAEIQPSHGSRSFLTCRRECQWGLHFGVPCS